MDSIASDGTADENQRLESRIRVLSEVTHALAEATQDYERLLDTVARTLSEVNSCICTGLTPTRAPAPRGEKDCRPL